MTNSPYIPGGIDGNRRVIIRDVRPQVDEGEYPIKRVVGDHVAVSVVAFADGHDAVACQVLYRHTSETGWSSLHLAPQGNDVWSGEFQVTQVGLYVFMIQGWVDRFATWHHELAARAAAGQDLQLPLLAGAKLVGEAALRARGYSVEVLSGYSAEMYKIAESATAKSYSCPDALVILMARFPDLRFASTYNRTLRISVDRPKAQYSTWYEMFPRSTSAVAGRHGNFKDCEEKIPVVAGLGFDVLYFPPIHPIGQAFRKGRNNSVTAEPGEVGSPWAIGSTEGGHKAIHAALGSLADFLSLIQTASEHGVEIALDIAFQCAPDHPYVTEHPEWFQKRPDGSIQYAENPPKKYQDIYPLNFETSAWWDLWNELKSVFVYWIEHGIKIFRVDNPHTKAFPFWKWVITEIKTQYPDIIFLAEAFTRPSPMYELAKLGFTQSYTYFTWRNNKEELEKYFIELASEPVRDFFRPNLWPNTPDILPFELQHSPPSRFISRLMLAATLSPSYGIYGSVFELCINVPKEAGSEEYLDSEKYEIKQWNQDPEAGLRPLIRKLNFIRAQNPALRANRRPHFHVTNQSSVIAFSKTDVMKANIILVVVDLDPGETKEAVVTIDNLEIGFISSMQELVSEQYFNLVNRDLTVTLDASSPARIYRVKCSVGPGNGGER